MFRSALDASLAELASDPSGFITYSPWQAKYREDPRRFRVIRAANRVGKTHVIASEAVDDIRGTNPHRPRKWRGPINVWLVGKSIEQMSTEGSVLEMLWGMLPKDEIDPRVRYERGYGIRGIKYPAIKFIRGPGKDSVIRIKTDKQDPETKAGARVHKIMIDEPGRESMWGELVPRVRGTNGDITIGFTPTPSMPDQTWLRELVEKGAVSEHHVKLTEAACWPAGYAAPYVTQAQIDEEAQLLPRAEVSMRHEATWDALVTDGYLTTFTDECVVDFGLHDLADKQVMLIIGIDHGIKPGKFAASFMFVEDHHTLQPSVWEFDEYQPEGYNTPEMNAAGILDVLERHGLTYHDVDDWIGDQAAQRGKLVISSSNRELKQHMALKAKIPSSQTRWINTPVKSGTSVWRGLALMTAMMASDMYKVHPRCTKTIEAFQKYRGQSPTDPFKDKVDASRYAVERVCAGSTVTPAVVRYS